MTGPAPRESRATPQDWVVRFSPADDGPWIIAPDGATFGGRDYGQVVGATGQPGAGVLDRRWEQMPPMDLVGLHVVSRDRFTGQWLTWPDPVGGIEPASPREERTLLDGGTLPLPADSAPEHAEQVASRRLADQRSSLALPYRFWLALDDGSTWQVPASGVTPDGLLAGFTSVERPRVMTGWDEVLDIAAAGGDLSWLSGTVPVTHRRDWTGSWMLGAGVASLHVEVSPESRQH